MGRMGRETIGDLLFLALNQAMRPIEYLIFIKLLSVIISNYSNLVKPTRRVRL